MKYERPSSEAAFRDLFGLRDVGLTHPDVPGFIKIGETGTIEIMADKDLGIILDPTTRTCSIFADSIKFFTKDHDGVRWNQLSFNPEAYQFAEPAFVKHGKRAQSSNPYRDLDDFLEDDE